MDGLDEFVNDINNNTAIKSGLVEISKLSIVDAFGQVMVVDQPDSSRRQQEVMTRRST